MTLQSQEVRTEIISASTYGEPVVIEADYDNAADVDTIHAMTRASVLDAVFLEAFNSSTSAVDLNLVLAPSDDASTSAIDDATVTVSIPAKSSIWVLQGQRFRRNSSVAYSVAAYVATADAGDVSVTGYFTRIQGGAVTA